MNSSRVRVLKKLGIWELSRTRKWLDFVWFNTKDITNELNHNDWLFLNHEEIVFRVGWDPFC